MRVLRSDFDFAQPCEILRSYNFLAECRCFCLSWMYTQTHTPVHVADTRTADRTCRILLRCSRVMHNIHDLSSVARRELQERCAIQWPCEEEVAAQMLEEKLAWIHFCFACCGCVVFHSWFRHLVFSIRGCFW